uniref:Putative glutathione s-transferase n=1 Tax=Corethrella appendiculata TaxID=1370023 RepID=U5EWQ7_9DIPT
MPTPVKFYYDLLSQHSRALYMFFEATKIPYEPIPVSTQQKEYEGKQVKSEYKEYVNRFQQVPMINDAGFKLSEGVTILKYLAREKLVPEHWYPRDSKLRARIDEFLEWQNNNSHTLFNKFVQEKFENSTKIHQNAENDLKLKEYKKLVENTLDVLENEWMQLSKDEEKAHKFMIGDKITIADILTACEVEQPKLVGVDPLDGRPKLTHWLEQVKSTMRPYYDEAHHDFYKITEQASAKN